MNPERRVAVYIEIGTKRVFAVAPDWPGWARSARTEDDALESLLKYLPRYRKALGGAAIRLKLPAEPRIEMVERFKGNNTTDFGAPDVAASVDATAIADEDLTRLITILQACWKGFDGAAAKVTGKSLKKGPRGGGRDLDRMRYHVFEGDWGYMNAIGGRFRKQSEDIQEEKARLHKEFIKAIKARAAGELPDKGPRGGKRWGATFAIRRSAWHNLDHAWELEDRAE